MFVWFEVNTALLIKIRLIEHDTTLNGNLLPTFQSSMGSLQGSPQRAINPHRQLTLLWLPWRLM